MRNLVMAWLLLAGVALWGGPATGHAVLTQSQPADGAALATAPPMLSLVFNEPVTPIRVQLIGPAGRPAAVRVEPAANGAGLAIRPAAALMPGAYTLSYRVTSADSHPVAGAIQFSIGTDRTAASPPTLRAGIAEEMGAGLAVAAILNRAVQLAALLIAAGGALFLLLHRAQDPDLAAGLRQPLATVALAGSGLSALAIGLHGAVLGGTGMEGLLEAATWRLGYASTRGVASATAAAGLLGIAMGMTLHPGPGARAMLGVGAVAAVASFALSGHAATASPRWLTAGALLLHVTLAAYWIGAFLPLRTALSRGSRAPTGLLAGFSGLAVLAVPALAAAGLLLGSIQVGALDQIQTRYSVLLAAKIALVSLLVALAAYNKLALTPRLARSALAAGSLRRTIAAELLVALTVLGVTAVLAQTPPPRTLAAAAQAPSAATVPVGAGLQVTLALAPGRAGTNAVDIAIADRAGASVTPVEVAAGFAQPTIGIEPILRPAKAIAPGRYRVDAIDLVAGMWEVEVTLLVTDFDRVVARASLRVAGPAR